MSFRNFVKLFIPKGVFKKIEPTGHLLEAIFFNLIHGFPFRGLKVIGVTGTNGKTTTSFMIHSILRKAGYSSGLMTTIGYGVNEQIEPQVHHMTTVSTPLLIKRIKSMKKAAIDYLVLETTSHALAQNRVWAIPYSVAVLTNMTHEHISYHGSFEKYVEAKLKLFKMTNRNKRGLRMGIINHDDPVCNKFANCIEHKLFYGLEGGNLVAKNIQLNSEKSSFNVQYMGEYIKIDCNLPGSFNLYNCLAAIGVAQVLKIKPAFVKEGIKTLTYVEGRMNKIDLGQNFKVIVDYAHTPDSYQKLFEDIRPISKNRIITVFGSLGGGDLNKRPEQGRIAAKYSDIVVLCEEDDRKEDGQKIINDISVGCLGEGKLLNKDLFHIHNRGDAIKFAIKTARKGDLVLVLGKGHEKTIEHADGEHPWSDINQTKLAIRQRLNSSVDS